MNASPRSCGRKNHLGGALLLAFMWVAGAPSSATAAVSPVAGQPSYRAPSQMSPQNGSGTGFSPGIADIIKMTDANLDAELINAFIKNSSMPYDPTVSELIPLK